jgi:hypothetical protein
MCRLKHIHDPVLSSLKMEGIRLLFFSVVLVMAYFVQQSCVNIRKFFSMMWLFYFVKISLKIAEL